MLKQAQAHRLRKVCIYNVALRADNAVAPENIWRYMRRIILVQASRPDIVPVARCNGIAKSKARRWRGIIS